MSKNNKGGKMMKRKFLSIILAATMVAGVVAGCGGQTASNNLCWQIQELITSFTAWESDPLPSWLKRSGSTRRLVKYVKSGRLPMWLIIPGTTSVRSGMRTDGKMRDIILWFLLAFRLHPNSILQTKRLTRNLLIDITLYIMPAASVQQSFCVKDWGIGSCVLS